MRARSQQPRAKLWRGLPRAGPVLEREPSLHTNAAGRGCSHAYLDKQTRRVEYRTGSAVLGGPHDVREIPAGLPGAGHLTCYDNGTYLGASRVVEIDPNTWDLVWQSPQDGIGRKHHSDFAAGAQRLAGGNTLVCDGANGRLFQVTRRGDVVWEFVNPDVPSPRYKGAVFKCPFYAPDHCNPFKGLPRD